MLYPMLIFQPLAGSSSQLETMPAAGSQHIADPAKSAASSRSQRPSSARMTRHSDAAPASLADVPLRRLPLFQPAIIVTEGLLARTHLLMALLHWMGLHQRLLVGLAMIAGISGLAPSAMRILGALQASKGSTLAGSA